MLSIRQGRLRRARSAVALARARLRATAGGRAARIGGALVAAGFAVVAIALRVSEGADAQLSGLVVSAARWTAWVGGVPLALAAAEDRGGADRREGVDALAASRGVTAAALASARAVAAMTEVASAIGLPVVALALLTAAVAGRASVALYRASIGAGAAAFAIVAGVTLGGIAAASGRVGGTRGRWLFVAVILGPWIAASLAGYGAWSIPGALRAVFDFALGVRSP